MADDVYTIEYQMQQPAPPRLLLHVCCGPCAAGALSLIRDRFDITAFYFNPNILPKEEFIRRLDALKTVLCHFNVSKLIVPAQNSDMFLSRVQGYETLKEGGARCDICFNLRLSATAQYLADHRDGYDFFATTLTVSPHKNAPLINKIGEVAGDNYGVKYLASDFKKRDGFLNSVKISKQLQIYRQNYCGCNLGV